MPFYKSLIRRANEAATAAQDTTARLQREISELKERMTQAQAELEVSKSAVNRLDGFEPDFDGDLQCPGCWVSRGTRSRMIPIPSNTHVDWFRCKTCHLELPRD